MITTYNDRIAELNAKINEHERLVKQFTDVVLPREKQNAVLAEKAKAERKIRRVQEDCELIQRELEKERVSRRVALKAQGERDNQAEKKILALQA